MNSIEKKMNFLVLTFLIIENIERANKALEIALFVISTKLEIVKCSETVFEKLSKALKKFTEIC